MALPSMVAESAHLDLGLARGLVSAAELSALLRRPAVRQHGLALAIRGVTFQFRKSNSSINPSVQQQQHNFGKC